MGRPAVTVLTVAAGVALGAACRFTFTDELRYACQTDSDCGGDGFRCIEMPGSSKVCCKDTGAEVCGDKQDNDCDGLVDGQDSWPAESCNGQDDDCDGDVDEAFDVRRDPFNCGRCGNACPPGNACVEGACVLAGETNCRDGVDDDGNGLTDCADPSCYLQSCGQGCRCQALARAELNCTDGQDNDGDSQVDCADDQCAGAGCGDGGCICQGNKKTETVCADRRDNDDDAQSDCADPDCDGQLCESGGTRRCASGSCLCNGGTPQAETPAAGRCRDRVDNDCDGETDCQEAACEMVSCNPDGGSDCLCSGGIARETNCRDRYDNDADGFTDCGDSSDCPAGSPCTYLNPQGMVRTGTCNAMKLCE
jgi:hypothetical protein